MIREPKNGEWWLCLAGNTSMCLHYADDDWWDSDDPRRRCGWSDVKPVRPMLPGNDTTSGRTLDQIIDKVRRGGTVATDDLRYAVVAFDVLLAQLDLPSDVARMEKYMQAAALPPRRYVGEGNDPENPEAVAWFVAMKGVGDA